MVLVTLLQYNIVINWFANFLSVQSLIVIPPPHRTAHYALTLTAVVRPSVRLSVCLVTDPMSRTEGHRKLKIYRKKTHDTDDLWPHLEVKISKFKVTSPLNAVTKKAIFAEWWGLRTSNLVQRWSTLTRITDMRSDIQSENVAVQVTTCGGRVYCGGPTTTTAAQLVIGLCSISRTFISIK